jgi:integral membrane protein
MSLVRLRWLARFEGITLLALVLLALPLKYGADWPQGVRLLGPVHGLAFVAWSWALVVSLNAGQCRLSEAFLVWLSAFVPGGFLWAERRMEHWST